MSKYFLLFALVSAIRGYSQSPYLSVRARVDSTTAGGYRIEMKFCEPKIKSPKTDWFSPDTSRIDFENLHAGEIVCGEYLSGDEKIVLGEMDAVPVNEFRYSNQVFAWEKILVLRISSLAADSSRPMYLLLPIRYKAFVTHVLLAKIPFEPGRVIYAGDPKAYYREARLYVEPDPDRWKPVDVKDFHLKEIL